MTKEIWINLPVTDIHKSKEFFTKIGFNASEPFSKSAEMVKMVIGENKVIIMLFPEVMFKKLTGNDLTDAKKFTEVLFSIGADSREEVDELAGKIKEAGGIIFSEPKENQGWMYGCGFADLDGHRWNVLYMDMSKMPKA
ncbi:MAG: VOC family protein [Ginsengibacter sp.]